MDLNIDTAALKRVAIEAGKAGLPFLEQALSAALVGVAGPFGMLVSPALNLLFPQINTMLGLDPDTPPDTTATRIAADPEAAKAALDTLNSQQQFELSKQQQSDATAIAMQAQQTALVAVEQTSGSLFQRGWRPAAAWICVGALAIDTLLLPNLAWVASLYGRTLPAGPDITSLYALLAALLGLGVLRTTDKATTASAVKAIAAPALPRRH